MAFIDLKTPKKSNELLFAQFNLRLERGVKQSCDICRTSYTVFKKQHICKRCYRSVCAQCSPFKTKTYLANRNIRLHRNCTVCNAESVKIQQYIEQNKLFFCNDSDLLFIWSKALTDRKGVKVSRSKSNLKCYVQLDKLWSSFNFSFRQFIGRLIQRSNVNDADLANMISNGLEQIEVFFKGKLEQGLYIYLFFLCHADVQIAVNLTLFTLELLEKSSATKISIKKMMQNIGFSEIEMYKIEQFILDNESVLKDSASVNVLPITATFDIVNNAIISRNINFMWKGILLLLFQRKEVVFKNINRINIITLDLLRNPNVVNLKLQLKAQTDIANGEDYEAKYWKLLNQYKALLARNEKLVKEQQKTDEAIKNKILTDSILGEQSSSSFMDTASSNLKFKPEEFNQILQAKNQQIIKLKMKKQELEIICKDKTAEFDTFSFQNLQLKSQIAEKDKRIAKLEQQKSNLKNINGLLIEKMKELSKMLMDQEQKEINKNNEVIEEIRHTYQQFQIQKKEQCNIY